MVHNLQGIEFERGSEAGLTPRAIRGAGEKSGGVGTTRELRLRCRVSGGRGEFDTRDACEIRRRESAVREVSAPTATSGVLARGEECAEVL